MADGNSADLRAALNAPQEAAFANEIISADAAGERKTRWVFLAEDGSVVGHLDPVPAEFDPRQRRRYVAAKRSDVVERSDLYIFATSEEAGFSLSRNFTGQTPGVMGADLAETDLRSFCPTSVDLKEPIPVAMAKFLNLDSRDPGSHTTASCRRLVDARARIS